MTEKKFEPEYRNGVRVRITGMAASSIKDNLYSVSRCTECHNLVAWAQSSKTGKWYPCETAEYTTEGGNPRFRAMPYQVHTCRETVWVLYEDNPYAPEEQYPTYEEALAAKTAKMLAAKETYEAYQKMLKADDILDAEIRVYTELSETFLTRALGEVFRIREGRK